MRAQLGKLTFWKGVLAVLLLAGGYAIAVRIFHGLGADVTLLYRGPLFLRGFDDDVRRVVATEMAKRGVALRFDAQVAHIERRETACYAQLADGCVLEAEHIMFATGRLPNTRGLGTSE